MDDLLDATGKTPPITMPVPKLDIEPLDRAAEGTHSKLTLPPPIPARARRASTMPPPIPARARAASVPPPIPTAAFPLAKPAGPALDWSTSDNVESAVTPLPVRSNAPLAVPLAVPPDLSNDDIPIDVEMPSIVVAPEVAPPVAEAAPDVALPPLPRPSAEWTRSQSSVIRVRPPTGSDQVAKDWYENSEPHSAPAATFDVDGEEVAPTTYFERTDAPRVWNKKLIAGIGGGVVVVGVTILALALRGGDAKPATAAVAHSPQQEVTPHKRSHSIAQTTPIAPVAPVETAPAKAAPAPEPAPSTNVQVPISSWPQGAIVTLVDNGNATVIGKTPMIASIDPSRSYDVVLAVRDRPTTVLHFDPRTQHDVTVDLDPDPAKAKRVAVIEPVQQPKVAPAPKPVTQHVAQPAPKSQPVTQHAAQPAPKSQSVAQPAPKSQPAQPAPKAQPVAQPKAQPAHVAKSAALTAAPPPSAEVTGTLMISSKPPCEIVVDGKPTHLMTPQQALPLSPGAHAITLVNAAQSIKKSIAVHIEAKRATKLVQDFTH